MPIKKTHYEILGVPRSATNEHIKKRYRELVRKYHPDVAADKVSAKAAFLEIAEAYKTLIDSNKRVIYDASIDMELFRVRPTTRRATASPSSASGVYGQARTGNRVAEAQKLAAEAHVEFIRGHLQDALRLCKSAQALDPRNVQASIILGDVYRIQGRVDEAIVNYTIAAQLDPRNMEIQAKLTRLARQGGTSSVSTPSGSSDRFLYFRTGLDLIAASIATFMFVLLSMSPGTPIYWLQNISIINTWSPTLVTALLVIGVMIGLMLSIDGFVQSLDEEMIFPAVRAQHGLRPISYPIGLIMIVLNVFSFYLASVTYILISIVEDDFSKSVISALLATFVLVLLASIVYAPGRLQVLSFGGNLVFPAVLFGWAIGDFLRPGS